ncbi:MAG: hypothetical protein EXR28_04430 [Betaproteobacteria bacterium]|nr:hypothetical protein [Betaproteobacteria bacterium]
MSARLVHRILAVSTVILGFSPVVHSAELNPAAVSYKTPGRFNWRDPTHSAPTNQVILQGEPSKPGI